MMRQIPDKILPLLQQRKTHLLDANRTSNGIAGSNLQNQTRYLACQSPRFSLLVAGDYLEGLLLDPSIQTTPGMNPACLGVVSFRNRYLDAFSIFQLLGREKQDFSGQLVLCRIKTRTIAFDLGLPAGFVDYPDEALIDIQSADWPPAVSRQLNEQTFVLDLDIIFSHPAFLPYQLATN